MPEIVNDDDEGSISDVVEASFVVGEALDAALDTISDARELNDEDDVVDATEFDPNAVLAESIDVTVADAEPDVALSVGMLVELSTCGELSEDTREESAAGVDAAVAESEFNEVLESVAVVGSVTLDVALVCSAS